MYKYKSKGLDVVVGEVFDTGQGGTVVPGVYVVQIRYM
jgi:hypothetical protein